MNTIYCSFVFWANLPCQLCNSSHVQLWHFSRGYFPTICQTSVMSFLFSFDTTYCDKLNWKGPSPIFVLFLAYFYICTPFHMLVTNGINFTYCPFHKTLPKSGWQMHWTSVRFYEMDVSYFEKNQSYWNHCVAQCYKPACPFHKTLPKSGL